MSNEAPAATPSRNSKRVKRVKSFTLSDVAADHVKYVAGAMFPTEPNESKAMEAIISHHRNCSYGMRKPE